MWRVSARSSPVLGIVPGVAGMHDVDDYPAARKVPGLVVHRYDSPLFFANAEDFRRRALAAVAEETEPVAWFVLNAEANVEVDVTALDALEALRDELVHLGIVFGMARVKQDLRADLDAYGLTESIGADRLFPTLPTAVAAYEAWRRDRDHLRGRADTAGAGRNNEPTLGDDLSGRDDGAVVDGDGGVGPCLGEAGQGGADGGAGTRVGGRARGCVDGDVGDDGVVPEFELDRQRRGSAESLECVSYRAGDGSVGGGADGRCGGVAGEYKAFGAADDVGAQQHAVVGVGGAAHHQRDVRDQRAHRALLARGFRPMCRADVHDEVDVGRGERTAAAGLPGHASGVLVGVRPGVRSRPRPRFRTRGTGMAAVDVVSGGDELPGDRVGVAGQCLGDRTSNARSFTETSGSNGSEPLPPCRVRRMPDRAERPAAGEPFG